MTWLSELIKQINLSRSFAGAILMATGILLIGPKYFPNLIDPVPGQWRWFILCAFVLCLAITVIWLVPFGFNSLCSLYSYVIHHPFLMDESSWEFSVLLVLGTYADKVADLDQLSRQVSISKLELLAISKKLVKRGLIRENGYDENLVSLTELGRKYIIKHKPKPSSA